MSSISLLICPIVAILAVSTLGIPKNHNHDERSVKKSYIGYKLLRTLPIEELKKVEALILNLEGNNDIQFWRYPKVNETADILASPRLIYYVRNFLSELGVKHDILIHNIDEILKEEHPKLTQEIKGKDLGQRRQLHFESYFQYDDIINFCKLLSETSNINGGTTQVTVESIGKSYENRDIILVKITNGGGNKSAIWLDGGMHAREWISPATVLYIMNTLVTDSAKSSGLLDKFDWYIVPVINVDGYEYTHTSDRLWRKTRSHTRSHPGCRGVDLNRNWSFHWGGKGSSKNPCSNTYRGPRAFSEPETQAVSNAILDRSDHIKMYLTFHSYSQLLLIPWSWGEQKPTDYQELYNLALKGKTALKRAHGTRYKVGTGPDLLYVTSGSSDDWAKGVAGIKYSYTFELRDKGYYGFALPATQIQPVGEETFNAVKAMAFDLSQSLKKMVA